MKKLTMESRIRDVLATDTGHDILAKVCLQAGISLKVIDNPVIGAIRLKHLKRPLQNVLDEGFFEALLKLINAHPEEKLPAKTDITPAWWKEAVFYQIYPRTFCDSDGDGIGDLNGIRSKLDHLQALGVNALWLCPVYDSPMDDNGYDIRDYRKINPLFGTMEQFDALLAEAHARNMKLIMDLVVNHTSDEHPYFQEALKHPDSPYRDYYFFRQGKHVPNNWTSFFSGSAWNRYDDDTWALHLFSKKQMDLNWDNPAVRKSVSDMVNWWLDKGVDGFRLDVINYISKDAGLPDGDESIGRFIGYQGIEHYYYGPNLHRYLHELHENSFARHHAFAIGECPGLGMEMARQISDERRGELDMIFSFDHLETPGHVRFEDYRYDLNFYRDYMIDWTQHYGNGCWMSLFFNNHDNPRMVSKIDPSGKYRREICELLAVLQMTLKGTPFIYQGDEMGLANVPFQSIDDLNDIESINYYKVHVQNGENPEQVWKTVLAGTRDHARIPLPWDEKSARYGQKKDAEVEQTYRQLIHLRRTHKALVYGQFKVLDTRHDRFVYTRENGQEIFLIDANLGAAEHHPWKAGRDMELVYPSPLHGTELGPYGVRIWYRQKAHSALK